ncbi:MAG: hypothetical protein V3S89_10520 [Desulfobacterales bacterium]
MQIQSTNTAPAITIGSTQPVNQTENAGRRHHRAGKGRRFRQAADSVKISGRAQRLSKADRKAGAQKADRESGTSGVRSQRSHHGRRSHRSSDVVRNTATPESTTAVKPSTISPQEVAKTAPESTTNVKAKAPQVDTVKEQVVVASPNGNSSQRSPKAEVAGPAAKPIHEKAPAKEAPAPGNNAPAKAANGPEKEAPAPKPAPPGQAKKNVAKTPGYGPAKTAEKVEKENAKVEIKSQGQSAKIEKETEKAEKNIGRPQNNNANSIASSFRGLSASNRWGGGFGKNASENGQGSSMSGFMNRMQGSGNSASMAAFQGAMQLNQMIFGGMNSQGSTARSGGPVLHMAGKETQGTTSRLGLSAMDMNLRLTDNAVTSSSRVKSAFAFQNKFITGIGYKEMENNHGKDEKKPGDLSEIA